jgi:hypothetical protein
VTRDIIATLATPQLQTALICLAPFLRRHQPGTRRSSAAPGPGLPEYQDNDNNEEDKAYAAAEIHELSPFGSIDDPWTIRAIYWMMVIACAHDKLGILRAYFYRQRRGTRAAEVPGSGYLTKPQTAAATIEAKVVHAAECVGQCSAANADCTPTVISRSAVHAGG